MTIKGKVIVFTGRISRPRNEFQQLVEDNGGTFSTSVSSKTNYLVAGEDCGSKLAKAALLGVKVISEAQLLQLLKEYTEEGEDKLKPEELQRVQSQLVTLQCKWCGKSYQQWEGLPDLQTCPVCEIFARSNCPHCNYEALYCTDFNMYCCMLCGTWFEGPHSLYAQDVKHLHIWLSHSNESLKRYCPCGKKISIQDYDIQNKKSSYEEAPRIVIQLRQQEEKRLCEEKAAKFVESLTDEERKQLQEELKEKVK